MDEILHLRDPGMIVPCEHLQTMVSHSVIHSRDDFPSFGFGNEPGLFEPRKPAVWIERLGRQIYFRRTPPKKNLEVLSDRTTHVISSYLLALNPFGWP